MWPSFTWDESLGARGWWLWCRVNVVAIGNLDGWAIVGWLDVDAVGGGVRDKVMAGGAGIYNASGAWFFGCGLMGNEGDGGD